MAVRDIARLLNERVVTNRQFTCRIKGDVRLFAGDAHHCHLWLGPIVRQCHRPKNEDKKMEPFRPRWYEEGIPWI